MPFVINIRKDPIYIEGKLEGKLEGKIESAIEMIKRFNLPISEVCKSLDIDESLIKKALGEVNGS